MLPPIIWMLRFMWRIKTLMLVAFFVFLGHIWWNRIDDAIHAQPQPEVALWCDKAQKVPFIPAEQCGGMTSCDRYAFAHAFGGNWACPK